MSELPPGFVLDRAATPEATTATPQVAGLPDGFVLDAAVPADKPSFLRRSTDVAGDVAQSGATGILKGVLGLAGLPGFAADKLGWLADTAAEKITGEKIPDAIKENKVAKSVSTERLTKDFEALTGKLYKPQTTAGEFAQTIGEFVPTGGRTFASQMLFSALPGTLSETGGQIAKGTPYEQGARTVGALLGGGVGLLASRPATASNAVSEAMRGVDDATMVRAGNLMEAAQRRGVALTWPEAVSQVTSGGATGLTSMQRVVENSRGGQDVMGPFMAQRPAQVDAAARRAFDGITPQPGNPSMIGPNIGRAAEETARDARAARSARTAEAYGRAVNDTVPPERVNGVIQQLDEIIARAGTPELAAPAQQLRSRLLSEPAVPGTPGSRTPVTDPKTGRVIRYEQTPATPARPAVPETNVGRLDEVYGSARDQFTGPPPVGQTGTEARAARYAAEAIDPLDRALRDSSAALREGREIHQTVTREFIDPLMNGPIGKLAKSDLPTKKAIEVLFERNPLDGSTQEIAGAMANLAARNRPAAQQLVRAHVATVFNKASRDLQGGANQFGGANFVAAIRGDRQQAQNLMAAIEGATSPQVARGFDEFLNVLSATGQRQRAGSATAFNQETQELLKRGGLVGEGVNLAMTAGTKAPSKIRDAFQQWQMGQNTEQIARLFTNQTALAEMRALAAAAPGSPRYVNATTRLATIALQSRQ